MNRERRIILLRWLKQGYINVEELDIIADEVIRGQKRDRLTMEEAREFIKRLEEQY